MFVNTQPQQRLDPAVIGTLLNAKTIPQVEEELKRPFSPKEIKFRAGATNKENTRALALAYIDARAVEDRLDEVFGPTNWWDDYVAAPDGGVKCYLTVVYPDGTVITKTGLAPNTDIEAVKGGESDALKRAGVKFGIARYLYNLPSEWVAAEKRGRSVVLLETPTLPQWALPGGYQPGSYSHGDGNGKAAKTKSNGKAAFKPNGKAEVQSKAKPKGDPGNFTITFGKNEGEKLSEISPEAIEWYANTMEAKSDKSVALQQAAIAYLATEAVKAGKDGNGNGNGNGKGDFVVPFGKNEGKKLSELSPDAVRWIAEEMTPINDVGESLNQAAMAYCQA